MLGRVVSRKRRIPVSEEATPAAEPERVQLHLVLPYKFEPREHAEVRRYLDRGYRIRQYQRVTDHEAVLTFERPSE